MTAPQILSRSEHIVSRKNIDPDAVKILYRLYNSGFIAYLVGGGVRDLLLGRRPKDFDISTSAHPQQVKKLFRNCFIVGRRFRLCHVRFGQKVVEVSTFRRKAEPEEGETLIRRDNTFGTPEEDAFRRDFTVNALFYDIGTFSVIDYVGGLADLGHRVIRTIGDPDVRFREDPVRMLRAVALGSRLGFSIDPDSLEAIRHLRGEIVKSSSARILEEMYKILRQGAARDSFIRLHETGLLPYLLPPAARAMDADASALLASLGRLDAHRNEPGVTAEELSNPVLVGTLLVPLAIPLRRSVQRAGRRRGPRVADAAGEAETAETLPPDDLDAEIEALGGDDEAEAVGEQEPLDLPFARRDLDRLRLMLVAQRRLGDINRAPHVRRLLASRHYFADALRWLQIHGGEEGRALASQWRRLDHEEAHDVGQELSMTPPVRHEPRPTPSPRAEGAAEGGRPEEGGARRRRRRRRRRRGPRREGGPPNQEPGAPA
jgi:poly(A) polymerase